MNLHHQTLPRPDAPDAAVPPTPALGTRKLPGWALSGPGAPPSRTIPAPAHTPRLYRVFRVRLPTSRLKADVLDHFSGNKRPFSALTSRHHTPGLISCHINGRATWEATQRPDFPVTRVLDWAGFRFSSRSAPVRSSVSINPSASSAYSQRVRNCPPPGAV
jgi:hypothetical protein